MFLTKSPLPTLKLTLDTFQPPLNKLSTETFRTAKIAYKLHCRNRTPKTQGKMNLQQVGPLDMHHRSPREFLSTDSCSFKKKRRNTNGEPLTSTQQSPAANFDVSRHLKR